jgi:hypothetical protein
MRNAIGRYIVVLLLGVLLLAAPHAFAAEQGQVGATSSATISMTVTIEPQVRLNPNTSAYARSGNPRDLAIGTNFDGGYEIEKREVEPIEQHRLRGQGSQALAAAKRPSERRYAYVIVPSVN